MVRANQYLGGLALMAGSAVAKEIAVNEQVAAELYDSGVIHNEIMESKIVRFPMPSMCIPG
jgi:hypothetical protein